ncbi:MAG: hypothetical protein HYT76_03670 [Deltaproteobacteria bacterium]|nr:hypothetical protein [Deltaproteobacteria bacterium]
MAGGDVKKARTDQHEIGISVARFGDDVLGKAGEAHQDSTQVGGEWYPLETRDLPPAESRDRWEGSIGFGAYWRQFSDNPAEIPSRRSELAEETARPIMLSNPAVVREDLMRQGVTTDVDDLTYLEGSETGPNGNDWATIVDMIFRGRRNFARKGQFHLHADVTARVGLAAYHRSATNGTAEVKFENEAPQQLCSGTSNHPRCQNPTPPPEDSANADELDPIVIDDLQTTHDAETDFGVHLAADASIGATYGRLSVIPWIRGAEVFIPVLGDGDIQKAYLNGGGVNLLYVFGGDKQNEGRRRVRFLGK